MDTHAVPGELTSLSRFAPVTTKHTPNQAMAKTTSTDRVLPSHELKGYLLGVVGVAIFSATLPMTKLAVGSDATPLMSGEFISFARAAIAALLSLGWLAIVRPPLPRGRDWAWLGITAFGVVLGFPLFSSMAMRYVDGTHASVVLGVLPLATAGVGALVQRRRAPLSFWLASTVGCALVVWFAARRSVPALGPELGLALGPGLELGQTNDSPGFSLGVGYADGLLLMAVLMAAMGYTSGAMLSARHRAETVISWALVITLPVTAFGTWQTWPTAPMPAIAWAALAYVAIFSMWIGFFAWYRALAVGGVMRVSQVQLLQPFFGILVSIPLLGETWSWESMAFASAVVASAFIGRQCLKNESIQRTT